ncbi:MAG: GH3 auxin-responsive promoter family protein [Microscillaceae bacterium]|jgi:hypothetical protein|nr:GH3 auxin-responsive promoter family protein [Microscillaceae bacterium]
MTLLGQLLKQGNILQKTLQSDRKSPFEQQKRQLLRLLNTAKHTAFGQKFQFEKVIDQIRSQPNSDKSFYRTFSQNIPIYDYDKMYHEWWYRDRENGERDVCWKGKVKYYALSSGTSTSTSKYIPVTGSMIRAIRRTSLRQFLALLNFDHIQFNLVGKGILMLGGSTNLNRRGSYYEGDLSGINAGKIPFWFQHLYKPGKRIAAINNWDEKIDEIATQAPKWNIAYLAGNPAWMQIMMEKIIQKHNLQNIHDVWPNLMAFAFGGVSFEPYRKGFEKLLGKPITYIETYLASEGFIAYQKKPNKNMELVLNNGLFFEFIPFTEENFDADGQLKGNPQTLLIDEVEEHKNYALLMSSCAGAWRYMIGDTIQFTNKANAEIIITGRTKHYLSLCGEHLSVDNMNKAIELVSEELNIAVREFAVAGVPHGSLFAHEWYIGSDDKVDNQLLSQKIDEKLKALNDDYAVERTAALKEVSVQVLPVETFYKWMEMKGKMGGQHKFPRVLKKEQYEDWKQFLAKNQ